MQSILVAAAVGIALIAGTGLGEGARYAITAVLAVAMGIQNATAQRLAVPELTTTVLTRTLAGLAGDGAPAVLRARRVLAVAAMLLGALAGALLALEVSVAARSGWHSRSRRPSRWRHTRSRLARVTGQSRDKRAQVERRVSDPDRVVRRWKGRDAGILIAAGVALIVSLGAVAALIVRSQQESRHQLRANLSLRAAASAQLVGGYLTQQEQRQLRSGQLLLSARSPSPARFAAISSAFGANVAVLLNSDGAALTEAPYSRAITGRDIGFESRAGREALEGRTTVSGVLPVPGLKGRIVGVLVPFHSASGRRVFAAAYSVAGGELQALVDRTSTVPGHEVYLSDGEGNLIAATPHSSQGVLADANPKLSIALQQAPRTGSLTEHSGGHTYAAAAVPGTHWSLVIDVPNAGLYQSISGLATIVPWVAFSLLALLAGALMFLVLRVLGDRARLTELSEELADRARTDTLTGLLNRRGIDEGLVRIAGRSRRREEPLTVLMIDLDRFKQVNDEHGHEAGDLVLKAFADCMRDALRAEDLYGRFGGDEFMVALTGHDPEAGAAAAARLRAAASAADLSPIGLEGGIALSIGVASATHTTVAELIRAADEDLYRDKAGRRAAARRRRSRPPAPAERAYWTVSVPSMPACLWPGTVQKNL